MPCVLLIACVAQPYNTINFSYLLAKPSFSIFIILYNCTNQGEALVKIRSTHFDNLRGPEPQDKNKQDYSCEPGDFSFHVNKGVKYLLLPSRNSI